MAAILQCLLRNCFKQEDDDNDSEHDSGDHHDPTRRDSTGEHRGYLAPGALDGDPNEVMEFSEALDRTDPGCCGDEAGSEGSVRTEANSVLALPSVDVGSTSSSRYPPQPGRPGPGAGLRELFRKLVVRDGVPYGSLTTAGSRDEGEEGTIPAFAFPPGNTARDGMSPIITSPKCTSIHFATTFQNSTTSSFGAEIHHNDIIPAISLDEVVLPGSALQKEMSAAVAQTLDEQGDECVICLEGFDPTNPQMPTLCGCGENKTYFHLPCLYQWADQDLNCPSCRQRLRWEEF